jgi:hypothetical protein
MRDWFILTKEEMIAIVNFQRRLRLRVNYFTVWKLCIWKEGTTQVSLPEKRSILRERPKSTGPESKPFGLIPPSYANGEKLYCEADLEPANS